MGKETSKKVAKVASKILGSGHSGKSSKTVAGSALSQARNLGGKRSNLEPGG